MFNVVTRSDKDPDKDFNGLWLNQTTGALFVWAKKAIRIGFAGDGKLISVDKFNVRFSHTSQRNKQEYDHEFDYDKVPLLVLAKVKSQDYEGSDIDVCFGSTYGTISAMEDFVIVNQTGNVELGECLSISCEPKAGSVEIELYVISYE